MRAPAIGTAYLFLVALWAAPAIAQETRVAPPSELQTTVLELADAVDSDRERLRALLQHPEVRDVARRHGIDTGRLEDAAAVLPSPAIQRLAPQIRVVEAALRQNGIRLSSVTIIVILLLLVLIVALS